MTTKLRKAEPTGFVYVLRAGNGLYKIGYAIHLDNRALAGALKEGNDATR